MARLSLLNLFNKPIQSGQNFFNTRVKNSTTPFLNTPAVPSSGANNNIDPLYPVSPVRGGNMNLFNTPASNISLQPSAPTAPIMPAAAGTPQASFSQSSYTGPSIVDYLASVGQASDYGSRAKLAAQHGIQNYVGSASQNTQLLNILRSQGGQQGSQTPTPPAAPPSNYAYNDKGQLVPISTLGQGGLNRPAVPAINPETGGFINQPTPEESPTSAYDQAVADVEKNLQPSEEEVKAQEELNKISESLRQGYLGEGDRAIPLPFITGRQRSLETRAATLAQPIEARAALAQAKRMAALEASKFKVEQEATKLEAARQAEQPIAGTSFYDPKTGQFVTAPESAGGFTLSPGQVRYDEQGNIIATGGTGLAGDQGVASSWVDLIKQGNASLSDVPSDLRNSVAQSLSSSTQLSQKSKDAIDKANVVIGYINQAVPMITDFNTGISGKAQANIPGSGAYNLERTLDTIKANVGFEALQAMRNASPTGGALGQVSEMENKLLQATLGSLDIGQDAQQLRSNLQQVMTHFNNLIALLNAAGTPEGNNTGGDGLYDW